MAQSNPKKPKATYDVPMIRDFLDHLLWELRISHHELTTPTPDQVHNELVGQLAKYIKKRNTVGLLASNQLATSATPQEVERASAILKERLGCQRIAAIQHLEALADVFDEALRCAAKPDTTYIKRHSPSDIF
jgi:hypothetical protein